MIDLYDPSSDPEPLEWSAFLAAEGLTAAWSYDVLRAVAGDTWAPPLAAVMKDGGQVCGVAVAVRLGLRRGPVQLDVRLPGYSHGPAWHFAAAVPPQRRRELLRAFERAIVGQSRLRSAGVVYRQLDPEAHALVARRGSIARPTDGLAVMAITWDSVDGWLASLRKSRRGDLRRQHRLVEADPGLTVTLGPARTDLDPRALAGLHYEHSRRLRRDSGLRNRLDPRAPLPAEYFAALNRRDDVLVVSYTGEDGRLLAFGTLLDHPATPKIGAWAALPADEGGRKHLYFDHYVRLVRHAIGSGAKELSAGRSMVEVKQSLGFEPVAMRLLGLPRGIAGR